jgi:predicted alpha/beta hydrolase family esterase
MVDGHGPAGDGHWLVRWGARLPTAERLTAATGGRNLDAEIAGLLSAVMASVRPVVLVGHGLGVLTIVHGARKLAKGRVRGAFLVAPLGETFVVDHEEIDLRYGHVPRDPLPFPATVVASRTDPRCPILDAEEWAYAWGAAFIDAGDSGQLDVSSGHGPWPEGLMSFAGFMQKLTA